MSKSFNTLNLFYDLLKDQDAFVTTSPPSDIATRLPALIIEASAPLMVQNHRNPGHGAVATVTISAIAEDDEVAFALADSAYSALWESKNRVTKWGWVSRLVEVQGPFLSSSELAAGHLFQYTAAVQCFMRK